MNTTHPPALTDRAALALHRARALRDPALFLHEDAADEVQERLTEVNRQFTAPAVVTPFAQVWQGRLPGARIVADAPVLDLAEGAHDLVVHALALHWADDPLGQIIQARRALKPDGLFLGVLFGGQTLHELRDVLTRAEIEVTGGLSPRLLPMGEIRDLGGLLGRAGLALPVTDHLPLRLSYRDLSHLAADLRAMGETNALTDRLRRPSRREIFARAGADYAARHPDPANPGRIVATFDMIFMTGWAPDPDQQKPLRPGSAKVSLADALKPRTP